MNQPCIFCEIAIGRRSAHLVFENDEIIAFLDHRPVSEGHVLVIPKSHFDYVFDLDDEFMSRIFIVAKKLSKYLKTCFQAPRVGLVVEGFGVAHVHLHLIPIYQMGDLDPNKAKSQGDLTSTHRKILDIMMKAEL